MITLSLLQLVIVHRLKTPHLLDHIMEFINDIPHEREDEISFKEFKNYVNVIIKKVPAAASHLHEVQGNLFEQYDFDRSESLDMQELRTMLEDIDKKLTSLPALQLR